MWPKDTSVLTAFARGASEGTRIREKLKSSSRPVQDNDAHSVETDSVPHGKWDEILQRFDDFSLMQTWSYGSVRWGEKNLSHVLLKKGSKIVAASQAVIFKAPLLPIGLAHIRWGPCWQVTGEPKNLETFRRMLQALYQVYVVERGLLIRIFPNAVEDGTGTLRGILEGEGFRRDSRGRPNRTLIMDLSYPVEELRQTLKRKWRHNLALAERNNLTISSGFDDEIFQVLMALQAEMRVRKKWEPIPEVTYLARVQKALPPPLKIMCMICQHQGEPASGIGISRAGNNALLVLAPTGNRGLKLRSSYLLQWRLLEWLKSSNVRWYDLSSISHQSTTGLNQFKRGLGGKLSLETDYVGAYQAGNYPMTRFSVQVVERSRKTFCKSRRTVGTLLDKRWRFPEL